MNDEQKFSLSWLYRWVVDNKFATGMIVLLAFLLNVLLITKLSFLFRPIGDFLGIIMLPIVLAAIFFYMLNPIVDWLETKKVPRLTSIILLFLIIIGLIVWGLVVAIPSLIQTITSIAKNMPQFVSEGEKNVNQWIEDFNITQFQPQIEDFMNTISSRLIDWSKSISTSVINGVGSFVSAATSIAVSIMIFPFILFYLLRDGKNLNKYVVSFLPNNWRKDTALVLTQVNNQLSSYVRGQLTVAIIVGIMFSILFSIIGLDYAMTLGMVAGALNLIPYLGSFLAMVPVVIIALFSGPIMLLKVAICFVIEQTIEGRFVSPLLLGSKLNIHPITILFVLLTAGKLFGLWGVLIGIPVYASAKVIIIYFYKWYRKISTLYDDEEEGLVNDTL
jgi:predicted PurR-regulated permease PerM